jgi:hypothetical protein
LGKICVFEEKIVIFKKKNKKMELFANFQCFFDKISQISYFGPKKSKKTQPKITQIIT